MSGDRGGGRLHPGALALSLALLTCLPRSPLLAQGFQVGTLTGSVFNAGSPLPGAAVVVVHQEQGVRRETATDSAGNFKLPLLPAGLYRVETSLDGFRRNVIVDSVVESERTTALTIQLTPTAREEITVEGNVPLVDRTNGTATIRVTTKELAGVAVRNRSFIDVLTFMPGAITVNVNGSLASTNTYLVDGVDVTDPATGFAGTSINFESIDEVRVHTAGTPAEYGRATGGVVSVVTRNGTNDVAGSVSYLTTNDSWTAQNTTRNRVTGSALARERFDHVNGTWALTTGAPIRRGRAWMFVAHERADTTGARRRTSVAAEDFQEELRSRLTSVRGDVQVTPNQRLWLKFGDDDLGGLVVDAFGTTSASELEALTRQGRRATHTSLQYTALVRSAVAIEAMAGQSSSLTSFDAYEVSALHVGAPHLSLADGRPYNGGAILGEVKRPRQQAAISASAFPRAFGRLHDIKSGIEWHRLGSRSDVRFPNDQLYVDRSFDAATRAFLPAQRRDYVSGVSESEGDIRSLYVRDKIDWGARLFLETGLRLEKQRGQNDAGAVTVNATTLAPRLAATYALSGDARSLAVVTAGRYYESLVQSFSDAFAERPPREIYDLFLWNGSEYVFSRRQDSAGRNFRPNSEVDPTYVDEISVALQRQFGARSAASIRGVWRTWHDLIDDVQRFTSSGTISREVVNLASARRSHRGVEVTYEKRWSHGWHALGSYTYADVRGNHFTRAFTALGDFDDAMCRTAFDAVIGTLPCSEVNSPDQLDGRPDYDRQHNLKVGGSLVTRVGPADVRFGIIAFSLGGPRYSKTRTVSVLVPGSTTEAGPTYTYYYDQPGSEKLEMQSQIDLSSEAAFAIRAPLTLAIRAEVFNVANWQRQAAVNNLAYCSDTNASAPCAATRAQFGAATTRNAFQQPRTLRVSAIVRF